MTFISVQVFAKITFIQPHIAHVIPGSKITAAFLKIKNDSDKPVDLISAKSDWAKTIELHTHEMEEGVMAMRKVDRMTVPANGTLVLKSKSMHIMIFKIQEDLKLNSKKKIDLTFNNGMTYAVEFKVQNIYADDYKYP